MGKEITTYIHNRILHTHQKKIKSSVAIWMEIKTIMLSKSQVERQIQDDLTPVSIIIEYCITDLSRFVVLVQILGGVCGMVRSNKVI